MERGIQHRNPLFWAGWPRQQLPVESRLSRKTQKAGYDNRGSRRPVFRL
jgi:hypothetical protein